MPIILGSDAQTITGDANLKISSFNLSNIEELMYYIDSTGNLVLRDTSGSGASLRSSLMEFGFSGGDWNTDPVGPVFVNSPGPGQGTSTWGPFVAPTAASGGVAIIGVYGSSSSHFYFALNDLAVIQSRPAAGTSAWIWGMPRSNEFEFRSHTITDTGTWLMNTQTAYGTERVIAYSGFPNSVPAMSTAWGTTTSTFIEGVVFGYSGSGVSAYISINNSTGAMTGVSDYRVKKHIQDITDGSELVSRLRPVHFDWIREDLGGADMGFIAHEWQSVVPQFTVGEKDAVDRWGKPRYQMLDESQIVPILTAAVRDLIRDVEMLESELTERGA